MVTGKEEFYAPTWSDWRSYGPTLLVGIVLFGLIHVPRFREAVLGVAQAFRPDAAAGLFRFVPLVLQPAAGATDRAQSGDAVPFPLRRQAARCRRSSSGRSCRGRLAGWPMMIDLGAIFLLLSVLINSRFGRNVEEVLVDWGVESWHRFGIRFAGGPLLVVRRSLPPPHAVDRTADVRGR